MKILQQKRESAFLCFLFYSTTFFIGIILAELHLKRDSAKVTDQSHNVLNLVSLFYNW